jgi:hypothetical protein
VTQINNGQYFGYFRLFQVYIYDTKSPSCHAYFDIFTFVKEVLQVSEQAIIGR